MPGIAKMANVFRRDHVTLCPDWADPDNQVELYDHRTDTTPLDLDSFENVNVATDAANAGVLQELTTQVKNGLFEPFIYKIEHFTKPGSGQT